MDKKKVMKGSPLLVLILATIIIGGAVAVLFDLFISGPTTGEYEITTDVRGLEAQLIQTGNWGNYQGGTDSTTLDNIALVDNGFTAPNCAFLVIHDYDLPTEDLTLTISVFETGTTDPHSGWTCTATFVEVWNDGLDTGMTAGPVLEISGQGPWVITNAQIEDLVYQPALTAPVDDWNALVLDFVIDGSSGTEYSVDWTTGSDYSTFENVDIIVSLATDA